VAEREWLAIARSTVFSPRRKRRALWSTQSTMFMSSHACGSIVGMPAEDFRLIELEGKSQSLSRYRGKIVLVNFWATWCKPCTTEMPAMQKMYDKLREKGFIVLAVNEGGRRHGG
jgi:thiol-disulfide isomerase/thioredoxin